MEQRTMSIRGLLRWQVFWMYQYVLLWNTIESQIRYTIPEELNVGSVVGNIAKDFGLGIPELYDRKLRIASDAGN